MNRTQKEINEENAKVFTDVIRTIAAKENNLDNVDCYLSHLFYVWMEKFAHDPESLSSELKSFAEMEI